MEQLGYSISEAARICGIGRTKLYEAISLGDLRAKKYGRRTIIERAALVDFMNSLENFDHEERKTCPPRG